MMPTWYWHSEQTQAKQSASVIWEISDAKRDADAGNTSLAESRQRALICTMPVGLGRVMYLSSDSTWRMCASGRRQPPRKILGPGHPLGRAERSPRRRKIRPLRRLQACADVYGEPIVVTIRVSKEDFTPMTGQTFKVVAKGVMPKDPVTGQVEGGPVLTTSDAVEAPESPGVYRATLSGIKPGGIEISLRGAQVEKLLATDPVATQKTLLVDVLTGTDREMRNVNADRNTLSRLAQAGNGISVDAAYADVLAQHVPNLEKPLVTVQQIGLFADPENPYTRKRTGRF